MFFLQVQLPPLFNMPKSQLQCYGETVYCVGNDMLSRCSKAESSLERFASVVAWSISTTRPLIFGVAPFNPILGETHHVSKGTLNVLLEQVVSLMFCALYSMFCSFGTSKNMFYALQEQRTSFKWFYLKQRAKNKKKKNRKQRFFGEFKMNNMQL